MRISRLRPSLLLLAAVSALAWSLSAGAAVPKLVQTGTVTMSANPKTVTITSVDPLKTFVLCQTDAGADAGASPKQLLTCELTNATTLTMTSFVTNASQTVRWYVVEFLSGVTVQRGLVPATTFTSGTTTVNVTITAVVLAKSFVLTSQSMTTSSDAIDHEWLTTAELTTTTNLLLTRKSNSTALAVAWQVIQIESASVQKGLVTIASGSTSITATLNPPVDTTRTFLVFAQQGSVTAGGIESEYLVTGEITNATTLTFTMASSSGTIPIAWFAVRMTDGTTVQRGLDGPSGTGAGSTPRNVTIPTAITINRSIPFISVRGDAASTSITDLDDAEWKTQFTSTTQLALTRNAGNTSNATTAWQVVQFVTTGSSWWPNVIDRLEIFP